MRRCLHAFLIGLLTLSCSMDAARACWYLRHVHRAACRPSCPIVVDRSDVVACQDTVVVVDEDGRSPWGGDDCACDGVGVVLESDLVMEHPVIDAVAEPTVDASALPSSTVAVEPVVESVIAPTPVGRVEAPADKPLVTAEPAREELPVNLESAESEVQQAAAVDLDHGKSAADAGEAAPVGQPQVVEEPVPPVAPVEPNLFEEADAAAATPTDESAPPAAEEPVGDEPSGDDDEPVAPAVDPFDAAVRPVEPVRRWIDRSGGYAVVASLVAVREDGMCVLAAAGRRLTVPLDALSDHDRDYATRAEGRLATGPRHVRATAGL